MFDMPLKERKLFDIYIILVISDCLIIGWRVAVSVLYISVLGNNFDICVTDNFPLSAIPE